MVALAFVGRVASEGEAELPRRTTTEEPTFVRTVVGNGLPSMARSAQRRAKSAIYAKDPGTLQECARTQNKMWGR